MTFLPIVARELRVASRRRPTYWMRSGAALCVVALGTWLFLMMRQSAPQELALVLFGAVSGMAVLYCLLSGVRATADCLSEEKRAGTLGLLFLTDLKGYDVVLGKLAATSLNAFYGVLAVVPMLAVPLLIGGVTLGEFGRMAVVAVNTLFFSLAIGICVSASVRSARTALGATFLLVLLFAGAFPACGAAMAYLAKRPWAPALFLPSPGFSFYMAFDAAFKGSRTFFWWSIGVIHALAWLFFILAAIIAPRSWQDRPAGLKKLRWRERWKTWSYGNSEERLVFRRRLLERNAFYWLAARARLKPALVWAVLGLLGCGWVWGVVKFGGEWLNTGLYLVTGLILNFLMKGWVAAETGRQLADDRQRGALELLLSTPLTVRDIVTGQRLALQRQFFRPLLFILGVGVALMLATMRDSGTEDERSTYVLAWTGGMLMLVADLAALYWVGMWQALVSRNPHRASSTSFARVLVLPWGAFALLALVISLTSFRSRGQEPGEKFFLALFFLLGLATDLGFGLWARHRFLTSFRLAAAQRYVPRVSKFKRWLMGNPDAAAVQLEPLKEV